MKFKKKKIKKKVIIFLFIFIFIIVSILFKVTSTSFAMANVATTNEYVNMSRTSGKSITKSKNVSIDNYIPDEYSFKVAFDSTKNMCNVRGGETLPKDPITNLPVTNNWVGVARDGFSTSDEYGFLSPMKNAHIRNDEENEFSIFCENIGSYKGKNVSLRISIDDYEVKNNTDSHWPMLTLFNPSFFDRFGIHVGNLSWVKVRYEFCGQIQDNGYVTKCSNPIELKGRISYNDIDYMEGVHLLNNTKKIYTRSNSKLDITNVNGASYVYSNEKTNKDGIHNPESSFTETFEGSSISRVYTFDSGNDSVTDTSGAIWNTNLYSGASLEYGEQSNGVLGKAVKKGDEITYKVLYTNDDIDNARTITVKSVLSKGLEYVKKSSTLGEPKVEKTKNGNIVLTWTIDAIKNSVGSFTYKAKVNSTNNVIVSNNTSTSSSNGTKYNNLDILKNSVPSKNYDSTTKSGYLSDDVTENDNIKYNIKYANVYREKKIITITEVLSKSLEYVKNSSTLGEPVITSNKNGTTKLVWTRKLEPDTEETLVYQAHVKAGSSGNKATSKTSIKIGDEELIDLGTLSNQIVEEVKKVEKQVPPKQEDTKSPVAAFLLRDSYTKNPIKNVKFILYNSDNQTIAMDSHGRFFENKTTDENGVVEWYNVPYGTYILKEVETSKLFKTGFYEYNNTDTTLISNIKFNFNENLDALKWINQGEIKGGTKSKEPYIERDYVKLGDINSDNVIDIQDLTLIKAVYNGSVKPENDTEKIKYFVASDINGDGKCNDGNCTITKSDIKLLEEYLNTGKETFNVNKRIFIKGSYQKRAALSLYAIPLDLKISNEEFGTNKKLKDSKFVIKDRNGNVYGNVNMDDIDKSIYLPIGEYIITQESSKYGYNKINDEIEISMDSQGNVKLLKDYKEYVKVLASDDGNIDHLIIYNQIVNYEVVIPYLERSERTITRRIIETSEKGAGISMIVGAGLAPFAKYGFSLRFFLLKRRKDDEDENVEKLFKQ